MLLKEDDEYRIAILLPYSPGRNPNDVLSYFLTFCTGAAGAADLVDFFILYTASAESASSTFAWPALLKTQCPPNVHWIPLLQGDDDDDDDTKSSKEDVGTTTKQQQQQHRYGLADYLMRVVDHKYTNDSNSTGKAESRNEGEPAMARDELLEFVAQYIQIRPYGLVEFKPALGHIFAHLLNK